MKTCSCCRRSLPTSSFYKRAASKDGLTYKCGQCSRAAKAAWASKNPEKVREYDNHYRRSEARRDAKAAYDAKRRKDSAAVRPTCDPDRKRLYYRRDYAKNSAGYKARAVERYCIKLHATPPWAVGCPIVRAIYETACRMRDAGVDVEVDHIYPLKPRSPNDPVGLHVASNLRIVERWRNRLKSNRNPGEAA